MDKPKNLVRFVNIGVEHILKGSGCKGLENRFEIHPTAITQTKELLMNPIRQALYNEINTQLFYQIKYQLEDDLNE